jgi:Mg2+ and Co2+ transporter CorA
VSAADPPGRARPPTGRLTGTLPRPRLGAPPGSFPYLSEAERAPARFRSFRYDADGVDERAPCSVAEAAALRGALGTVWVDVAGTKDHAAITEIGRAYGIHPLVQEDLALAGQRPKLEGYPAGDACDEQLFVVARMLHPTPGSHTLDEQVGLVIGPGYLLTFQEGEGDLFEPVRERIRKGGGRVRHRGPDYLAYALLDVIVDGYFVVLERIGERIERVEEAVMEAPRREHQAELRALRRDAIHLRRAAWPLRDVLAALLRDESGLPRWRRRAASGGPVSLGQDGDAEAVGERPRLHPHHVHPRRERAARGVRPRPRHLVPARLHRALHEAGHLPAHEVVHRDPDLRGLRHRERQPHRLARAPGFGYGASSANASGAVAESC